MKNIHLFIATILLVTGVNSYANSVNIYGNLTDYSAATGSELFLIDFDGSPNAVVDGSTISVHAVFGSPEANDPTLVNWSSDALSDTGSTVAFNNVGPVSIDFTDPVFAFSLDFLSASSQEIIQLYDSSDTLIGSVLTLNATGFFGMVSEEAIDYAIILNGTFSAGSNDRFFIDNLTANTVVPVPATAWLFGSGLVGLVGFARRKA